MNGIEYIEYPLGLGAILLGHGHSYWKKEVMNQLDNATLMSLPHPLETEVAEKIHEMIPSAQMCRFLKTGSEATSAAVRLARAFTGKLDIVTCGYHGWHDWYAISTPRDKGIPGHLRRLCIQTKYNDLEMLKEKLDKKVAAFILEPYVYEEPKNGFLERAVEICHSRDILVIFDEIVTGLRSLQGSAQRMFSVVPDITCLGKALGNGLPISCVCGRKDIMEQLEGDVFVSSTHGAELTSLAAAKAVLRFSQEHEVWEHIWEMGRVFTKSFNESAFHLKLDCKCIGYPCRTYFQFPSAAHKSLFWQECLKRGILFGHAQFISYSHKREEIDKTCMVMHEALSYMKNHWTEPETYLEGKVAKETVRRVEEKK